MKIRLGFVSNSSSSSFILNKEYFTELEINKIKEFINSKECEDWWDLREDEVTILGYTTMDNGSLSEWIEENINPPIKAFKILGE